VGQTFYGHAREVSTKQQKKPGLANSIERLRQARPPTYVSAVQGGPALLRKLQYRAGRLCSESCSAGRAGRLVVKPIEMGLAEIVRAISAELMVFDGSAEDIVSEAMKQLGLEARPSRFRPLPRPCPLGILLLNRRKLGCQFISGPCA
jgi:hypothetical protein